MTIEQAGWLIAELRSDFYRGDFPPEAVEGYVRNLLDLDYNQALAAVRELGVTAKFMPSIEEIRTLVSEYEVGLPNPDLAWELVGRRFGSSQYTGGDRSVELCDEIRRALEAAGIDAWRYWTADERHWLRRDFIECYSEIRSRILRAKTLGEAPHVLDRVVYAIEPGGAGGETECPDRHDEILRRMP